jgi:Helix-turn-helix domain
MSAPGPMSERQCLRTLALPEGASPEQISHAYDLLKRVYGTEAANLVAPAMEEFSPEARAAVLAEIEEAYQTLSQSHGVDRHLLHPPVKPMETTFHLEEGCLKELREALGMSLDLVAAQTRIRPDYLSALEEERFADLPLAAVNIRGFLTAFVKKLGLAAEPFVPAYMLRYQDWQARRPK